MVTSYHLVLKYQKGLPVVFVAIVRVEVTFVAIVSTQFVLCYAMILEGHFVASLELTARLRAAQQYACITGAPCSKS